jgi:hypothetical protein
MQKQRPAIEVDRRPGDRLDPWCLGLEAGLSSATGISSSGAGPTIVGLWTFSEVDLLVGPTVLSPLGPASRGGQKEKVVLADAVHHPQSRVSAITPLRFSGEVFVGLQLAGRRAKNDRLLAAHAYEQATVASQRRRFDSFNRMLKNAHLRPSPCGRHRRCFNRRASEGGDILNFKDPCRGGAGGVCRSITSSQSEIISRRKVIHDSGRLSK